MATYRREFKEDLVQAKQFINDFCQREYQSNADFSNLSKVGIAYTTSEDEKHTIQVNVNLITFAIEKYLDGQKIEDIKYASLKELIENELAFLEFDELIQTDNFDEELPM